MFSALHGIFAAAEPLPPVWLKMSPDSGVTLTGGKVSAVDVGSGYSAIQTTDSLRPVIATVGGFNVFRFNGANALKIPTLPLGESCFFFVFKATANGLIIEHSPNTNSYNGQFLYTSIGSTIAFRRDGTYNTGDYYENWGIDGARKVVCFRVGVSDTGSSVTQFYVNSTTPSIDLTQVPVVTTTDTLFIGSRNESSSFPVMDLALMETYGVLKDGQVAQRMNELMTTYNAF